MEGRMVLIKKRVFLMGLIGVIALIVGIVGYGYFNTKPAEVAIGDYISITCSGAVENSEDINTQIWSYDCNSQKTEKVFEFEYTSQYPLGYYDKQNQLVYYTKRAGNPNEEYGDQIFVADLSNNEEKQLTENLFAVNYILSVKGKVLFAGRPNGSQAIKLGAIDKKTNEISYWGDEDINIQAITVDRENEKIYVSTYSEKDRIYSVTHQDGPVGQNNFKMPKYTVYEISYDFKHTELLFSDTMLMRTVMLNGDTVTTLCDKQANVDAPSILYSYNLKAKELIKTTWETDRLQVGDANYSSDGTKIYGISSVGDIRGLYEYQLDTKSFKPLFLQGNSFINNVQVVKGTMN